MKSKIFAAFLALGLVTSATAQVTLIQDDFEGFSAGTMYPTESNTTSYINTADGTSRVQIYEGDTLGIFEPDPVGCYAGIAGNSNKHITTENALDLTSYTSLTVTLDLAFRFTGCDLQLLYSASGDFSDQIVIQHFDANGVENPSAFTYDAGKWYTGQSVTFSDGEVIDGNTIHFTDTAKLRWRRTSSGFNTYALLDNIKVEAASGLSKGTVIMISSVNGWLVLCLVFFLRKEIKRHNSKK